jgi:hypothetical protein
VALATATAADNENRTLDLVRALTAGRLWIDPDAGNTVDLARAGGHFYSGGAPGLAFVLLPFQLVLGFLLEGPRLVLALTVLGAGVPLALSAVGVRRAVSAAGASQGTAALAAVAHSLGTIALPFATRLYSHSLVVCLVAWALASILERRRLVLAGALAAFAVVSDYNVAIVAASLLALAAWREGPRGAAAFALGAVGPAVLLAAYHTACFGRPWRTPYDAHADPGTQEIVKQAYGFSYPRPRVLLELLFGTRRGFLFTQPVALAGLVGLGALACKDRTAAFALGVAALVLLANAARARDWSAGASFGARYTAAALPFLALGYPLVFEWLGRWRALLLGASFALAFAGASSLWGFDVITVLETLWVMGPRSGATVVLAGLDDNGLGAALASVLVLSFSLPAAALLLAGPARREWLLAAALVPGLAGAHGVELAFFKGKTGVIRERQEVQRDQFRRAIESSVTLHEAQERASMAERMNDPELAALAKARLAELEAQK